MRLILLYGVMITTILDQSTTITGILQGYTELNPLMYNKIYTIIFPALYITTMFILYKHSKKYKKTYYFLTTTKIITGIIIITNNLLII